MQYKEIKCHTPSWLISSIFSPIKFLNSNTCKTRFSHFQFQFVSHFQQHFHFYSSYEPLLIDLIYPEEKSSVMINNEIPPPPQKKIK